MSVLCQIRKVLKDSSKMNLFSVFFCSSFSGIISMVVLSVDFLVVPFLGYFLITSFNFRVLSFYVYIYPS